MKNSRINLYFAELLLSEEGTIEQIIAGDFGKNSFQVGTSIYSSCSFLEGILDSIPIEESLQLDAMKCIIEGQEFHVDAELIKTSDGISFLLHNRHKAYQEFEQLNQSRNDLYFLQKELKQKNIELERLREKADRANEEKSRFLAMMSHEVRNPLNVILGYTELIGQEAISDKIQDYLKYLTVSGRNLKVIVEDILDLSRVEAGKLVLSQDPISLATILSQISNNYENSRRDLEIELVFNCGSDVPNWVLGDDVRIYQILTNLINNSIKFTLRGSVKTSIKLIRQEANHALISFQVKDTGRGMTPEQADSVFEEYKQNELDDNRVHKGAGLGLAIVKRLVSAMEGTIRVESALHEGTTFSVDIPFIIHEGKQEKKKESTLEKRDLSGKAILAADDNYMNRSIVEHILNKEGVNLVLVKDGVEALAALQQKRFDLVLLDINMPNLSGEDLIKMEDSFQAMNKSTPFLALTGNSSKEDVLAYRSIGFKDVIPKPFSSDQLLSILRINLPKE